MKFRDWGARRVFGPGEMGFAPIIVEVDGETRQCLPLRSLGRVLDAL